MYAVRQCKKEEIEPLFRKMTKRAPDDVHWDSDGDVYLRWGSDSMAYSQKYIIHIPPTNHTCCFFEFVTGVDNIRFDGRLPDDLVLECQKWFETGKGTSVKDFIDLDDVSVTKKTVAAEKKSWWQFWK